MTSDGEYSFSTSRRRLNIFLAREAVPVEHSLPEQSKTILFEKGKEFRDLGKVRR